MNYSQGYGFSSGHVWMWELDYKESWALKNWWFWTVMLEKTLESPLDCKEIKQVNPKGNQSWISLEGLMLSWSSNNFGHLMRRTDSFEKTLMLGGIGGRRRRGRQRMRWLDGIQLNGHEFVMNREAWHAVVLGVAKSQTRLSWLNWTEVWDLSDIDHKATMLPVFKGLKAKSEHSSRKTILLQNYTEWHSPFGKKKKSSRPLKKL